MILLVGLGNPGSKYEKNRHNIGFMALDEIVQRYSFGPWKSKFSGEYCEGSIAGTKVMALKPLTYMNESGQSVGALARFYKISIDDVIVMHDELDLAFAKIKVKTGGGHGGHNGLRSIDAHLGKNYKRLRLGIGHPGSKEKVHAHVLGDFAKAEQETLMRMLDEVSRLADHLVGAEDTVVMNKYALAMQPQRPNKEKKPQEKQAPAQAKQDEATEETSPFAILKSLKKDDTA